ncbi:para-nitrobenzyl esterase [Trinickia symbiotica]|nr:carboxylesterase family protein [Trinickia symbiotica]PPK44206.1 para-nitrobenzyl esterase [Trinickia symbiotica]
MRFIVSRVVRRTAAAAALSLICTLPNAAGALPTSPSAEVRLNEGVVQGERIRVGNTDLHVFRGIPYAAPPIGELRWREPQPVGRWAGVRDAREFGPRCMQSSPFRPVFRSKEMSEDCLYLNVWAPAPGQDAREGKRPVLVYFHGGGFIGGDGSEGRYDGENFAARRLVVVTVNYRLGVFGFLAPPEAARESPHGTAGNYGLLDQVAALRWVRDNIAQFGGDPEQVTIAGNSAGSISVSAHMASPLSRGLFARAIGESGAAFAPLRPWSREEAERAAGYLAERVGATSLNQLRALPASTLLDATAETAKPIYRFWPHVDGHFLPESPESIFASGRQAPVPLLLGVNSQEGHFDQVLGGATPTPENWRASIGELFRDEANGALAFYPGKDDDEVMRSGTALATDLFVGHSTWRWMDLHRRTGRAPVYFYHYAHIRPPEVEVGTEQQHGPKPTIGAVHSAEIEYALGNLDKRPRYAWRPEDYKVSQAFSTYIAQFVRTGNPNRRQAENPLMYFSALGLTRKPNLLTPPNWPAVREEQDGLAQQVIRTTPYTSWNRDAPRHAFLQRFIESRDSPLSGD